MNLEAHLDENPRDARAAYTLGRIHYMAFSCSTLDVPIRRVNGPVPGLPTPDEYDSLREWEPPRQPSPAMAFSHARQSIRWQLRAFELDEDNALYVLGLASLCEDLSSLDAIEAAELHEYFTRKSSIVSSRTSPGALGEERDAKQMWCGRALRYYRDAFDLARREEKGDLHQPIGGLRFLVSYEAANGYLKLSQQAECADRGESDKEEEMERALRQLEALPAKGVTPVIVSLFGAESIEAVIDHEAHVAFDLDGTGRPQRWKWVRPEVGLLVWDPEGSGIISSGTQLFGTVAWWMFWESGYDALASLDDNGDGWLAGPELLGIRVWRDENCNGLSDPGEVRSPEYYGICALAATWAGYECGQQVNPTGVRFDDGTHGASWDWVAEPADRGAK